MYAKLLEVEKRYEQIQASLMEPGVATNQERFRSMMKESSDLEKVGKVLHCVGTDRLTGHVSPPTAARS